VTNFILRIKEQETFLTLHEHDDNDRNKKQQIYKNKTEFCALHAFLASD